MRDPICASTFVDCGTPGRTSVPAPKVAGRWPDRTLLRSAPADGRRRCERTSELAHGKGRRRSDSSFRTTTDKSGPQATPLALCTSGAQVCDGTVEASASASSCVNCRMDVKSQGLLPVPSALVAELEARSPSPVLRWASEPCPGNSEPLTSPRLQGDVATPLTPAATSPKMSVMGGWQLSNLRAHLDDDLNNNSSSGDEQRFTQKGEAVRALRKTSGNSVNVHAVTEVQKMLNGSSRVDAKVRYYRNSSARAPMIRTIERNFMHVDVETGEPIVNVSRLRSAVHSVSRQGHEHPRTPPIVSREEADSMRRERHKRHSMAIERALDTGRKIKLDQRIGWLHSYEKSQQRHISSCRLRVYLTMMAAWLVSATLASFPHAHMDALAVAEDEEKTRGMPASSFWSRQLWLKAGLRSASRGVRTFHHLSVAQAERISTSVVQTCMMKASARRAQLSQRRLSVLAHTVLFLVVLRRPLAKHQKMEVMKDFIDKAWRGFLFRMSIKVFHRRVTFLQRVMRNCIQVKRIVQDRILLPHVWMMEREMLNEVLGREECVKQELAAKAPTFEFEHWRAEAQHLIDARGPLYLAQAKLRILSPIENPNQGIALTRAGGRRRSRNRSSICVSNEGKDADTTTSLQMSQLTFEGCCQIVSQLYRENVDRWWQAYDIYRNQRLAVQRDWKLTRDVLGADNFEWWPEQPTLPEQPQELLKVHREPMRRLVRAQLRQSPWGSLFSVAPASPARRGENSPARV